MTVLKAYTSQSRLLVQLRRAAKHGVTKHEMDQQRVEYIVGAMSDEKTEITSEMVKKELGRLAGEPA